MTLRDYATSQPPLPDTFFGAPEPPPTNRWRSLLCRHAPVLVHAVLLPCSDGMETLEINECRRCGKRSRRLGFIGTEAS